MGPCSALEYHPKDPGAPWVPKDFAWPALQEQWQEQKRQGLTTAFSVDGSRTSALAQRQNSLRQAWEETYCTPPPDPSLAPNASMPTEKSCPPTEISKVPAEEPQEKITLPWPRPVILPLTASGGPKVSTMPQEEITLPEEVPEGRSPGWSEILPLTRSGSGRLYIHVS